MNTVATAVATTTTPKRTTKPRKCNDTFTQSQNFNREPDGIKIIVDRPRRENYRSQQEWASDMANYRCLADQAKKCERIKTRIPADIPADVHNGRRDWYRDNGCVQAPYMSMPCGWGW